jgi:hypothetical protein
MKVLDNSVLEILVTDLTTKPNESFNGINSLNSNTSGEANEAVKSIFHSKVSKVKPLDRMISDKNSLKSEISKGKTN